MPPTRRPSAARVRLLETASRIFYEEGIHTVGVDRVISEAQVTRATFYRHFPSKEDLVLAYLEAQDRASRDSVAEILAATDDPAEQLERLVDEVAKGVSARGFRGCPFVNAAAEYPDTGNRVHQAVLAWRAWYRETVAAVAAAAGRPDPEYVAQALLMLRDGAASAGYLEDGPTARDRVRRAAAAVIA